jgi:gas vesicle protein
MTSRNKVVLGILGAAAAGVVIGLLIAPEKGKEIRKKIKDTAGDWADNLSSLWSHGKEAAEDAVSEGRDKVRSAKSTAEDKANKIKESLS